MLRCLLVLSALVHLVGCYTITDETGTDTRSAQRVAVTATSRSRGSQQFEVISRDYDGFSIKKVLTEAYFEFYNALMYRDNEAWIGRIVGISGPFPGYGPRASTFVGDLGEDVFYFAGMFNRRSADVIVMLDHPIPRREDFGKLVPLFSPGQELVVIGRLGRLRTIMDDNGYSRMIPTLECLLVYDHNDFEMKNPLWVSQRYELLPEGTVTYDSLRFEFPKKK